MLDAAGFRDRLRPLLARSAGYAQAILGTRADAEDAVQQAALRAWAKRAQFDPARPFRAWWYAILRNQCRDMLRQGRRMPGAVGLDAVPLAVAPDEGAVDRVALDRALANLPKTHAEILKLRYFGDLDYAELAAVLDIPKGTVMSRLHLARKALAALMRSKDI